jgi:acyl-CoA thioesterase I
MTGRIDLKILTVAALLACSLGAMADTNAPPAAKIKIACVGDSVTAADYPQVIGIILQQERKDKYEVANFGVPGATALKNGDRPYASQKKIDEITAFAPQIVTIMLGASDSTPANWKNKDLFSADYKALIATFKNLASKPKVYVLIPTPVFGTNAAPIDGTVLRTEITPLITKAAEETRTDVIDTYAPFVESPSLFPDGAHPNNDGSEAIGRCIFRRLTGAPLLEPNGDIFVNYLMVKIMRGSKDPVYYTLDGKWPATNSLVYKGPIRLTNTTRVTAMAIGKNGPSPCVTAMFLKVSVYGATKLGKMEPGLYCSYYENKDVAAFEDMDKLSPISNYVTNSLQLTDMDPKKEYWGCKWTGYITVPKDGVYKFILTSDDGSTLRIDNSLLVDNNGGHSTRERSGKAAMKAGPHSIAVTYYNLSSGWSFKAEWETSGMPRQLIPPTALSHEVAGL